MARLICLILLDKFANLPILPVFSICNIFVKIRIKKNIEKSGKCGNKSAVCGCGCGFARLPTLLFLWQSCRQVASDEKRFVLFYYIIS